MILLGQVSSFQKHEAPQPESGFGLQVAALGDLNQDGYMDILVAAPDESFGNPCVDLLKITRTYDI